MTARKSIAGTMDAKRAAADVDIPITEADLTTDTPDPSDRIVVPAEIAEDGTVTRPALFAVFGIDPTTVTLDGIVESDVSTRDGVSLTAFKVYAHHILASDSKVTDAAVVAATGRSAGWVSTANTFGRIVNRCQADYDVTLADGRMTYTVIGRLKSVAHFTALIDAIDAHAIETTGEDATGEAIMAGIRQAYEANLKAPKPEPKPKDPKETAAESDAAVKGADGDGVVRGWHTRDEIVTNLVMVLNRHYPDLTGEPSADEAANLLSWALLIYSDATGTEAPEDDAVTALFTKVTAAATA